MGATLQPPAHPRSQVKADPTSEPSWQAWVQLEESQGAYTRADELRAYCLQNRVEESMGALDLSPAAAFSVDSQGLGKVFAQIGEWFGLKTGANREREERQRRGPRKISSLRDVEGREVEGAERIV